MRYSGVDLDGRCMIGQVFGETGSVRSYSGWFWAVVDPDDQY
jgi:hypothetical protein